MTGHTVNPKTLIIRKYDSILLFILIDKNLALIDLKGLNRKSVLFSCKFQRCTLHRLSCFTYSTRIHHVST